LIERATGAALIERMRELSRASIPPVSPRTRSTFFERMLGEDAAIHCVPLIHRYAPYARDGFRVRRIAFADMLADGERSPNMT